MAHVLLIHKEGRAQSGHAGTVQFGVVADINLVPRSAELARHLRVSFAELANQADGTGPTAEEAQGRTESAQQRLDASSPQENKDG